MIIYPYYVSPLFSKNDSVCTRGGGRTRTDSTVHKILSLACLYQFHHPGNFPNMSKNNENIKNFFRKTKNPNFFLFSSGFFIMNLFFYNPSKSELEQYNGCTPYPLPLLSGLVLSVIMLFKFFIVTK